MLLTSSNLHLNKSLLAVVLSCALFASVKAEYLVYKMVGDKAQPISQESEYAKIYGELMTFQFPMSANSALNLGKKLSKKALHSLNKDEQAFLELHLRKNVDKNLRLLWLPETVFEHFAINYFLCSSGKYDRESVLEKLQTFKYDFTHEEEFGPLCAQFNEIMGQQYSNEEVQAKLRTLIPETKKILAKKGLPSLHCGYPLADDPVCKATRREYEVASNAMNRLDMFQRAYCAVNRRLFEFLNDSGCKIDGYTNSISKEQALSILNKLIADLKQVHICQDKRKDASAADSQGYVDEFANYQTATDYAKFVQEVDLNLADAFNKIIDIEFEAKKNNSCVLYRATNGIGEKLDSPVKYNENTKTTEPYWLSYGRGIYASALCDKGACASHWIKESKFFYALLIDKAIYRQNVNSDVTKNIFHIHPYNTIISLFGNGNYCHPRACSFTPTAELQNLEDQKNYSMETLQAMFIRPALFVGLFSLDITPEACEQRFTDYCNDKHVRMIISREKDGSQN